MIRGADYAWSKPSPAALAAAGCRFVARYLTGAGKALTPPEVAGIRAAGLDLVLIFEESGSMAGGYDQGYHEAIKGRQAATTLNLPIRRIYFSLEAGNAGDPFLAYLNGARMGLGDTTPPALAVGSYPEHVGIYSVGSVVRAAMDAGYAGWEACWGCPDSGFDPRSALRQVAGDQSFDHASVDWDVATVVDYGQCFYTGGDGVSVQDVLNALGVNAQGGQELSQFVLGQFDRRNGRPRSDINPANTARLLGWDQADDVMAIKAKLGA